ncbi:odorant receptor 94a-like [Lucilia sericata]|uniref:odorant receptor 94a-like n=1 Tax=Lucilia sericata TaxID=13632 RepID=UPI0018A87CCA|nr:odorant receptor 94a-like [Lucilia sericata]
MFKLYTTQERVLWQRVTAASFLYMLSLLFLKTYELRFPIWTPFDWKHPSKYWYAYIYELCATPLSCLSNVTSDMLHCYRMQHLALYFKFIAMRLENLGTDKDQTDAAITKKLLAIIELHLKLLRKTWFKLNYIYSMSRTCERIVSYPFLTQILLSGFIFLPYYYADKLTTEFSHLTNSTYNCNWPEMSPFNRKLILIYMQYLQQPVIIKAGIFFEVGLPVYAKTMNNAYSFFALLLNTGDE